jgi:septal ring factor EnvC (AmiA/AmiB activator)
MRDSRSFNTAKIAAGVACLGTALLLAAGSWSAEPEKVKAAISEQTKTEQAAAASQKKIEQLDDETSKAGGEYRRALAEAQSLKGYNDQLAEQVKSQSEQMAEFNRQLGEIQTTSREVMPMMSRMLDALVQFVKLDLPFLPDERATRIAQLQDMMSRADVSVSEKYRRLVEAYQIEIEYGRTMEAYQGKVDDKTVEFLRVGRVSLMYQTLDGKETGYWDVDGKKWVRDDDYKDDMHSALKVAKKQAAPDFVAVAIRAPGGAT